MALRCNRSARLGRLGVLLLGLLATALTALAPRADAQVLERWPGKWLMLAATEVAADATRIAIDLGATQTPFKALRIESKGGAVEIERVAIAYGDRTTFERAKPFKIAANGRSWPLDLRRSHKFVDAVTISIKPGAAARIEIWGLQDSHGARSKRASRAAPSEVAMSAPAEREAAGAEPPSPEAAPATAEPSAATRGVKPAAPQPTREAAKADAAPTDWQIVPVFYGTDRAAEANAKRVAFSAGRGRRLELGRALVTVPRGHAVPQIERPWVVRIPYFQYTVYEQAEDPAKHFTIKEIANLTREEFIRLVGERLAASRTFKDHAFVFVHGFNTSFDNAMYRTAQLAYDLKFDGVPFAYSWPSKGQVGLQDYNYDRESAGQAEPHLRSFLDLVIGETGAKSVSIIAHSMGNQVLLPTLRDIKRALPQGVVLNQVILAAPDVDRDNFEFLAREIEGVSRGMTLYAASNDRAMEASRRYAGGVPRAGDVPVSGGPVLVPGVDTIDVTAISTEVLALNHSGFAEKSALLNDLQLLIQTGERPPDKRIPILEQIATDKGAYWRYPRTR